MSPPPALPRTPLDAWLAAKLGLPAGQTPGPEALAAYQLAGLQKTLEHALANSPFYRRRLAGGAGPASLAEFADLPLVTARDLREHHLAMLCVSQDQVARVVTLSTSGTTAAPKRIYFSDQDLELTLEFFRHGMATLVGPGRKVLILLPGATPDSVGDLLARALGRLGVEGLPHGPLGDPGQAIDRADRAGADCLVGIPVQVLAMAEHPTGNRLAGKIKSVLLTTDYVPAALAARVRAAWGCQVFEHWGMTETGLGGGVDCAAHQGYHLRAGDLYFEVVEPESGRALPPGQWGELVVSTLNRQAMPLVRYRTGDWARLLPGACPCGGATPRMDRVPGRLANRLDLPGAEPLPMWQLDEALFALPGLLDYRVAWQEGPGAPGLALRVQTAHAAAPDLAERGREALRQIPQLAAALARGSLVLGPAGATSQAWPVNGSSKRTLL